MTKWHFHGQVGQYSAVSSVGVSLSQHRFPLPLPQSPNIQRIAFGFCASISWQIITSRALCIFYVAALGDAQRATGCFGCCSKFGVATPVCRTHIYIYIYSESAVNQTTHVPGIVFSFSSRARVAGAMCTHIFGGFVCASFWFLSRLAQRRAATEFFDDGSACAPSFLMPPRLMRLEQKHIY